MEQGTELAEQVEPQAPTAEEKLESLQTQLTTLTGELEVSKKSYKGLQETVNKKDAEIKRQSNLDSRIEQLGDRIDLIATAIAAGYQTEEVEGLPKDARQDILKQLETQRQELKKKKEETEATTKMEALQTTVLDYQKRVESLGLKEEDDAYWQVYDLVTTGDPAKLRRADILLGKLETKPKEKESDEERIERITEEKLRKTLEERGLLTSETGSPSASSTKSMDAYAKYARGEISEAEAKRLGAVFS